MAVACSSAADDPGNGQAGSNGPGGKADNTNGDGGATGMTDGGVSEMTDGGAASDAEAGDGTVNDTDGEAMEMPDPFAQARDVNLHLVSFPEGTPAPSYRRASVETGFRLNGTEFWQKWPDGLNPTYSYAEGSEFGKRCMYASARRFEAIMTDPPEDLVTLYNDSNWGGSFFNWNDDYALSEWSDGRSARLWAWRTSLIKWISQTNRDGTCYLPTYEMVEAIAANCLQYAQSRDREIQGCRAP